MPIADICGCRCSVDKHPKHPKAKMAKNINAPNNNQIISGKEMSMNAPSAALPKRQFSSHLPFLPPCLTLHSSSSPKRAKITKKIINKIK